MARVQTEKVYGGNVKQVQKLLPLNKMYVCLLPSKVGGNYPSASKLTSRESENIALGKILATSNRKAKARIK